MNCNVKEYIDKNGLKTKYAVIGNGKRAFVIIPGLSIKPVTETAEAVAEAYKIFADEFTIYLFDRPLPVTYDTSIDKIAENLYEILTSLNIDGGYFLGASQGGMILQVLMLNHPEIIKKAVLASTAGRTDNNIKDKIGEWMHLAKNGNTRELYLRFFSDVYSEELMASLGDGVDSLIPDCTEEELENFYLLARAGEGFDAYSDLHKAKIPTLVIGSKNDRLISAQRQTELAESLNAELYLYPDFGHAVYDEAPDFKQRLYDFFMI